MARICLITDSFPNFCPRLQRRTKQRDSQTCSLTNRVGCHLAVLWLPHLAAPHPLLYYKAFAVLRRPLSLCQKPVMVADFLAIYVAGSE